MKIRQWRQLKQHPLGAEYEDIKGDQFDEMLDLFQKFGNVDGRRITLAPDYDDDGKLKVLDGWQLLRCYVESPKAGPPPFSRLSGKISQDDFIRIKNDNRRHETPEAIDKRQKARMERIAKARSEGKSIRAIADKEDVSPSTVQRDLEKAAGVPGGTPEPKTGKVAGKDGKSYSARKPVDVSSIFCARCIRLAKPVKDCPSCEAERVDARATGGKTVKAFNWGIIEKGMNAIANVPEEIATYFKVHRSVEYNASKKLLNELLKVFNDWRKRLR